MRIMCIHMNSYNLPTCLFLGLDNNRYTNFTNKWIRGRLVAGFFESWYHRLVYTNRWLVYICIDVIDVETWEKEKSIEFLYTSAIF